MSSINLSLSLPPLLLPSLLPLLLPLLLLFCELLIAFSFSLFMVEEFGSFSYE